MNTFDALRAPLTPLISWRGSVTHSLTRVVTCVCVIAALAWAPTLAAQDTSVVVVQKDRIEITMIPPKLRIRQPRLAQTGFYSWRVDLKTSDGLSIVLASDTLMRTDNIRDIVRGSTLRGCADGKDFSSRRCHTVMTDSVSVSDRGDELRIVIRDSTIVALVRKDRPHTMWGSTFEPNGRFRVDRLSVDYDDIADHQAATASSDITLLSGTQHGRKQNEADRGRRQKIS